MGEGVEAVDPFPVVVVEVHVYFRCVGQIYRVGQEQMALVELAVLHQNTVLQAELHQNMELQAVLHQSTELVGELALAAPAGHGHKQVVAVREEPDRIAGVAVGLEGHLLPPAEQVADHMRVEGVLVEEGPVHIVAAVVALEDLVPPWVVQVVHRMQQAAVVDHTQQVEAAHPFVDDQEEPEDHQDPDAAVSSNRREVLGPVGLELRVRHLDSAQSS